MSHRGLAFDQKVKIALALHSKPAVEQVAGMLAQLGIDVVADGAVMSCLYCDQSKCAAQLIIADAESLEIESKTAPVNECTREESQPNKDRSVGCSIVPIVLVGESPETSPVVFSRRIMGFLRTPFDINDLSSVVDIVLKNQAEIEWLQKQCDTYRSLLDRLRQNMGNGITPAPSTTSDSNLAIVHHPIQPVNSNSTVSLPDELTSFESIPHAVQEVDPTGRLRFSNPAHCQLHGYEPGQLVGRMIWELLATEKEQQAFRQALEDRLRNAPPPMSYQTKHRRRDGKIIDVQVDWTYKRDRTGAVEGYISIVTDITQQLRERRELQQARDAAGSSEIRLVKQLEAADQALKEEMERRRTIEKALRQSRRLASLGIFAAGIAHEINNPITAGLNSAETALALSENTDLPTQITGCIVNVVHATRRCQIIVKDLLRFASQQATERRPHAINYVVNQSLSIVKRVLVNWPARLELDLTEPSPHVSLNLLEMEIVVANLVQNAMDAAREKPNGRVIVATRATDDQAILTVSDNGCGIPKERLDQIFDPFFTTKRATGGTGLGLSIVYAIVRNHLGEISVKSSEGNGTTFTILLPKLKGEFERDAVIDSDIVFPAKKEIDLAASQILDNVDPI